MDVHHRKIDLQSPQDFVYLRRNISAAAQVKLELNFPPSAAPQDKDDAFKTKVEVLVQQYITQTLALALPSLSINGLDVTPAILATTSAATASSTTTTLEAELEANYEPYDARLASKLRALYATLEVETTRIAELRREAPAKAAGLYVERLRVEMEGEAGRVEESKKKLVEGASKVNMDIGLVRAEDVDESFEKALRGLEGLRGVTEGVAKLERAREVVREIEGL